MGLFEKYSAAAVSVRSAAEETSDGLKLLAVLGVAAVSVAILILLTDRQILKAVRD